MMNNDDLRGVPVYDASGEIGRVADVRDEPGQTEPGDLWVTLTGQTRPVLITRDRISDVTPERVMLGESWSHADHGDQAIKVPLHEEVLEAATHKVERGRLRIHKTVEKVPYEEAVTVGRDDVSVDRVAVGQLVDRAPQPRWEGDTLIVPLVEEVLVVEKRLRVREELRITRARVEEQHTVREDLRREVANVETDGETGLSNSG